MKNNRILSPTAVGGSSLLVIFAVLCMTVFATLSLNTALAEQRLAEANRRSVVAYYEADLQAQAVFARLRSGETVPAVTQSEEEYHYAVPFSRHQVLKVALHKRGDVWTVVQWQTEATPEEIQETLPVWQGLQR